MTTRLQDTRLPSTRSCEVDIVIPVFNEEQDLEPSVQRLSGYLATRFPFSWRITIADNASTDGTWPLAQRLARDTPGVHAVRLEHKGRGRALQAVWSQSDAEVLAYMDVDLSTDLAALLPLVAPLLSGHSDVAIGTRLARSSRVVRGAKREVISRCYNLLLRTTLHAGFSDAQCGFKALRRDCARQLLPLVQDGSWFFDTELLVLAERGGLRIHEVPVDWTDDPDSRVDILATAREDLRGIVRLGRGLATGAVPVHELGRAIRPGVPAPAVPGVPRSLPGQLLRFAAIGVASTLAYLLLFVLLRGGMGAQPANFTALLVTAVVNTAANRRLTFGIRGRERAARSQLEGLAVFGLGLLLTSGALAAVHATDSHPARWLEVTSLVTANLLTTVLRFLAMRIWVFAPRAYPNQPENAGSSSSGNRSGNSLLTRSGKCASRLSRNAVTPSATSAERPRE